ncbi:MAG: sugar transferase [Candidatus Riflebacteria bacterium]|nr:sugar transferase [Candidatus Riflebacteria bacterium]
MITCSGEELQVSNKAVANDRVDVLEHLYQKYRSFATGSESGWLLTFRYWRKKYAWMAVTRGARFLKRLIDIIGSLFALMLFSPIYLIVGLLIKLSDGGPILYWQIRIGQFGREFQFPKFRSMTIDADSLNIVLMPLNQHKEGITFKLKHDPRITWIGKIIRRFSIDELPQLWCVLIGDMSLVGPRPPLPREVSQYTLKDRRRLEVIPGLTCIWQVSGRADIPFPKQVELDMQYIESQSLWLDIKILLQTIPAILNGKGAY